MIKFYLLDNFHGEGISQGIERGVLVDYKGECLVQEGLGLGAPAIKTKTRTFFSCNSKLSKISETAYLKKFYIDSELIWEFSKSQSERFYDFNLLTILINKITDLYKILPHFQRELLPLGIVARNFFQTHSRIKSCRPIGSIAFRYNIFQNHISVNVDFSDIIRNNGNNISKICVLNELGGDFFDASIWKDKISHPPSGWEKLNGYFGKKLYSKDLKIDFGLEFIDKIPNYNFDFIIGREKVSNFCWAGFDIEIDVRSIKNPRNDCNLKYICGLNEK